MSKLPWINAGEGNLRSIAEEVWHHLLTANTPPTLFRNGGNIVWIEFDNPHAPLIRPVDAVRLRHHLAQTTNFYKKKMNGDIINARPPNDLAPDLLARPDKSGLPGLRRVSTIPLLSRNGGLVFQSGYDPASEIFFALDKLGTIPVVEQQPCDYEVEAARDYLIHDLLGDFPFTGPADLAHTLAGMIQPFVRLLIDGPTPLYLIEKPTPGTGGTLLAHAIAHPALGHFPAAVTQPHTAAEWRYSLLSWLRDFPAVILIDNLTAKLDNGAFASVLTDVTFRERVIGTSDAVSVPNDCLWIATGNNPTLSTEIARRTVSIRLDARLQNPDTRKDFRHADLRQWVADNRGEMLWAILTLIQAWAAAGKPSFDAVRFGGFESWASTIGGILSVAGVDGFLANRDELRRMADVDTGNLLPFVDAWWARYRDALVGVADLWDLATDLDLGGGPERAQRIRLGRRLDALRDRRFGPYRVEKGDKYKGSRQYRLRWETEGVRETVCG
jgi:hypothetical protein